MRVDLACYLRQYARPERLRIGGWACAAAIQGQGCVVHEFSWSKEASSTSSRSTCFFPVVAAARSEARARLLMRRITPRVFSKILAAAWGRKRVMRAPAARRRRSRQSLVSCSERGERGHAVEVQVGNQAQFVQGRGRQAMGFVQDEDLVACGAGEFIQNRLGGLRG